MGHGVKRCALRSRSAGLAFAHGNPSLHCFQVSLGLGSLLAMTVLLGIVAGAMPKSNSIPLLGYYILSVILLCAVAVAISMAFMTASKRYVDNARIPSQLTYRLSLVRPRLKNKARAVEKGRAERTKSLGEQLLGIRFTEFYHGFFLHVFGEKPKMFSPV